MSKGQVLGLERAELSPFYGRAYFLKALGQYMDLADLPRQLMDDTETEAPDALRMTLAFADAPPRTSGPSWVRAHKTAAIVAFVMALAGAAYASLEIRSPSKVERMEPLPARSTAVLLPAPASVPVAQKP